MSMQTPSATRCFGLVLLFVLALCMRAGATPPPDPLAIGGVQGVMAVQDDPHMSNHSTQVVATLQPVLEPIATPIPPAGTLSLWMEGYTDLRLPIGSLGRLKARASQPGYLMLWTMDETGMVLPIADGMAPGRAIAQVGPNRVATFPSDQGFEIAVCPPTGQSVWFALHSDLPIPEPARQRLAQELSNARIDQAGGVARFREVVERVVAATSGWAAHSYAVVYTVLPGKADARCVTTDAAVPPPPPPAPAPAPTPVPGPALSGLQPSARPIEVYLRLDNRRADNFRANETMTVEVIAPAACPGLTVLALGAGGAIDVLQPAARPLSRPPAASETVWLPPPGGGIQLIVRVPPAKGATERVVALCDPRSAEPLFQRRAADGPTATLRPQEPEFLALVRKIEEAQRSGRLLVGVAVYTNLGARE